jgi:hypothetical protein
MKKLLIISVISIFLLSCNRKIVEQNFKRDSISYIEKVTLDTIYIPLPSDTTYVKIAADCPDQETTIKSGNKEIKVVIKDKILYVSQITKKDSIALINSFKSTKEYKDKEVIKIVKETVFKTPSYNWYVMGFQLLIIGILLFIIWLKK